MPQHRIVVIGDEDGVFGLGLLGLEGRPVTDLEQARHAVEEAMADPTTALILLTEEWADAQPESMSGSNALVVEIPGPQPVTRSVALQERIERALGVHLEG
jgi:vacuolar-type H+-ATPase subunit F/Vma7